jgi:hypothetical protein
MHMPSRPFGNPVADQRRLVGGVIVHDEMDVEFARHRGLDLIQELAELDGAMATVALADNLAGGDVEGSEQRGRAMANVVVAAPRRICDFSSTHNTMACSGGET